MLLFTAAPVSAGAQRDSVGAVPGAAKSALTSTTAAAIEKRTVTRHEIVINGRHIDYDAVFGNIILKSTSGEPIGSVYYTAYIKQGVSDERTRPITFAYNGGPGSSSLWLHIGVFGPRRVLMSDTAHLMPPYRIVDNEYTLLDKTDIVFIDPVGTGFSNLIGKGTGKDFWGIDEDAASLAQFVTRYVTMNARWNSPRYLAGESYGTTRSAALVHVLQRQYNMDFNGVILVSCVLDFQTLVFNSGNDIPYMLFLPTYAAIAWYHHLLPDQPAELRPFLREVEDFATTTYIQALLSRTPPTGVERQQLIDRLHRYTGLSKDYLDQANLRVNWSRFAQELLRTRGLVVGRLDGRFTGANVDALSANALYDPQSTTVSSAFVSAFNGYLHDELGVKHDAEYPSSRPVNPWNWNHRSSSRGPTYGIPGYPSVAPDLAQAMIANPHLHVMLNTGLYDLANPYFAAEWTLDRLEIPASLHKNIREVEYEAGHMMYLHEPSMVQLKHNIAEFIDATSGVKGMYAD